MKLQKAGNSMSEQYLITEDKLRTLREFRLMDDTFMAKFFEKQPECTELLLHIILENESIHVSEVIAQCSIQNLQGRSIRLDIYAKDDTGKPYNIEIQRAPKGASRRRARYNSSVLDANITESGDDYDMLTDSYVIFITETDVLGQNRPIYHIERTILEDNIPFDDGSHIIYINAEYKDDSPLGLLMQDFYCKNPHDMHYSLLKQRATYLKENPEGVTTMCKLMEDMMETVIKDDRKKNACKMLEGGKLSYEEIAEYSGLTVDEVKALDENRTA